MKKYILTIALLLAPVLCFGWGISGVLSGRAPAGTPGGGDTPVEDDMADNSISDWKQAGITVTFDVGGWYEITEMMAGMSLYQDDLTFVTGRTYYGQFDIKNGVSSGQAVSLEVGETFAGGESLSQEVTTTAEWVTEGPFEFVAGADTVAMRFALDLPNNGSILLRNFSITSISP
jgi:hypothetical protein